MVPVDEALFRPELVAPEIHSNTHVFGDPEEAVEAGARQEEGFGRHGFRSLIEKL
jgi:hypothetical protein